MTIKQKALAIVTALLFGASAAALAEQSETETLVSGDEPMNVANEAQVTNPEPDAAEQAKTQEQMDKVNETSGAIEGSGE
jgi:hypothetical protein